MSTVAEQGFAQRLQAIRLAVGELRQWLRAETLGPGSEADRASLRRQVEELTISLDKLDAEPTLLTIVFLGGTGVGKSTLLNALAGTRVAPSSLARPTTQFSTLYHHAEVDISALPEVFRTCRRATHDRSELRHKILVDTPDIDGAVLEHHERLKQILPVADAILYVGSAEKYHDRAAWQLLLDHAPTRGFAFVLNKWDRCLAAHDERTGRAPDEDFRRSLQEAGFASPLLFRVCGKQWEAHRAQGSTAALPIADDFEKMQAWIEHELDERLIQEIKSRGIARGLDQIVGQLPRVIPPDWTRSREQLADSWLEALRHGVEDHATLLIESTDGQARELERHFGKLGRNRIGGLFGLYLHLADRLVHLRGSLLQFTTGEQKTEMQRIAAKCLEAIPVTTRQTQREAMRDRLLTLASRHNWSVEVLGKLLGDEEPSQPLAQLNEDSLAQVLVTELRTLEKDYADPRGSKRAAHAVVRSLCTWVPIVVLVGIGLSLLYSLISFQFWGVGEFFSAALLFGLTIAALHFLMIWVFPVNWVALREKLRERLEEGLLERLADGYLQALDRYTAKVNQERALLTGVQSVLAGIRDQIQRATGDAASSLFSRK